MCKHVAAVLYGVGARLDREPQLFFTLRAVDGGDLIAAAAGAQGLADGARDRRSELAGADLGAVFGIELDTSPAAAPEPKHRHRRTVGAAARVRDNPSSSPPSANSTQPVDDGFAEVFGPGLEVTEAMLTAFGVDIPRLRRWLHDGILLRTRRKGVHRTTARTLALVRTAYARSIAKS
jgi:hypothetical protein